MHLLKHYLGVVVFIFSFSKNNAMNKIQRENPLSAFDNQRENAMLNVIFTGNWLLKTYSDFLKNYGLTTQQYNLLWAIALDKDKTSVSDLKARMMDRNPNLTRLANFLEERRLISRYSCPNDRRSIQLKTTPKGNRLLETMTRDWESVYKPHYNLSEEEAGILNKLLHKIRENPER
ncbi:MAG: MarR family transcriptional regulator [Saprospirales bacterium]|nr:MAG: MarR family transcriptional regulator [Saprospirales bacterium]